MNVDQLAGVLQDALSRSGGWSVEGDASFNRTLTIGQILKARIMRHYEGGRYLAEIDGQQKVVDSTIPLRVGEQVRGRVTALGERVQLQRVADKPGAAGQDAVSKQVIPGRSKHWLDALFARYEASLGSADRSTLLRQAARVPNQKLMALGGLVLSKLGTQLHTDFLRALYRVLDTEQLRQIVENLDSPCRLACANGASHAEDQDAVQPLAGLMEGAHFEAWRRSAATVQDVELNALPVNSSAHQKQNSSLHSDNPGTHTGWTWGEAHREWLLGERLLNTQNEGSVSHRLTHLPLWFGDRLVEIRVALFAQREASCSEAGIRHRRLVISLETEHLGPLEIRVTLADRHVRLSLTTGEASATEFLARHFGELKTVLSAQGWEIDEIDYLTESSVESDAAVQAVVEHHIAQDSLSRLM